MTPHQTGVKERRQTSVLGRFSHGNSSPIFFCFFGLQVRFGHCRWAPFFDINKHLAKKRKSKLKPRRLMTLFEGQRKMQAAMSKLLGVRVGCVAQFFIFFR